MIVIHKFLKQKQKVRNIGIDLFGLKEAHRWTM